MNFVVNPEIMFTSVGRIVVVLSVLKFSSISCGDLTMNVWTKKETVSSLYAVQSLREYMEDTHVQIEDAFGIGFYAIFDGHTGDYSSIVAAKRLAEVIENEIELFGSSPENCSFVERQDDKLNFEPMLIEYIDDVESYLNTTTCLKIHQSGTTCLIVVAEKNRLTVANVGDSRGVMCNLTGSAIDLSVDHKPDNENEKKRIEEAGGLIYESGVWRVHGLAMSRSLGDNAKKWNNSIIIATPDIRTFDLDEHQPKFMILASDGLWDVMTSQEAVDLVKELYQHQEDFGAKELVLEALVSGSPDNITVLVVVFKNGHYEVGSANV